MLAAARRQSLASRRRRTRLCHSHIRLPHCRSGDHQVLVLESAEDKQPESLVDEAACNSR